jgi:hypothetical protein
MPRRTTTLRAKLVLVSYVTPSLGLREELFFALVDISGLRQALGIKLPVIRERDTEELGYWRERMPEDAHRWTGIRFGTHLDKIGDMPMRSPVGLATTTFRRLYGPGVPGLG